MPRKDWGSAYAQTLATGGPAAANYLRQFYTDNISWHNRLRKRFPNLSQAEVGRLQQIVNRARTAAARINTLSGAARLKVADHALNTYLFGEHPGGDRYQYYVDVRFTDQKTGVSFYRTAVLNYATLPTVNQLTADAVGLGKVNLDRSPEFRVPKTRLPSLVAEPTVTLAQRRY